MQARLLDAHSQLSDWLQVCCTNLAVVKGAMDGAVQTAHAGDADADDGEGRESFEPGHFDVASKALGRMRDACRVAGSHYQTAGPYDTTRVVADIR